MIAEVLASYELAVDPHGTDADLMDIEASYLNEGGCFELIEDGAGRVLGSWGLCAHTHDDAGRIESYELRKMYLRSELRGQGWGRRMLERAIDFARARGAQAIVLETATRLEAARRLYQSYGFVEDDEVPPASRCDLTMILRL
jgi:putative acetyltransferase